MWLFLKTQWHSVLPLCRCQHPLDVSRIMVSLTWGHVPNATPYLSYFHLHLPCGGTARRAGAAGRWAVESSSQRLPTQALRSMVRSGKPGPWLKLPQRLALGFVCQSNSDTGQTDQNPSWGLAPVYLTADIDCGLVLRRLILSLQQAILTLLFISSKEAKSMTWLV